MFFGTTPSVVGQYLVKAIQDLKPKRAFIPFSGNFVVEQLVAQEFPDCEIHCTDVSLYSRGIGLGVTDQEFKCELKQEIKEMYPIFGANNTPLGKAAQIMFLSDAANNLKKVDIPYYQRLIADSKSNEQEYYDKIMTKLNLVREKFKNTTFHGVDAMKITPDCRKGDFVFYDPPVLLGDYEKMFKNLENCYDFEQEPYTEMTDEVIRTELERLDSMGCNVYYRTNNPLPDEDVPSGYNLIYKHEYKYNASYCLYTNIKKAKTHAGRFNPLKEDVKNYPMIGMDDVITQKSIVQLVEVSSKISNHYRLMWVKKAQMTDGGYPYLVVVDGKVIGMVQISSGLNFGIDMASIFSDPACPHSRYKRLSKLIVAIISTQEFLDMFNEKTLWKHNGLTTRVFTNNNSSMKYRGLFTLAKSEEDPNPDANYKRILIYQNRNKIMKNYKMALNWWIEKYSNVE